MDTRRFVPLLAATGVLILVHQGADLLLLLPGIDFGTPAGRVRQLLAIEARSPAVLAADFLLLWALVLGRGEAAVRFAGILHWVIGAVLVLCIPFFLFDAGRVAGTFGGSQSTAFRVVVARTLLMLLLLGIGAILAGRAIQALVRERQSSA